MRHESSITSLSWIPSEAIESWTSMLVAARPCRVAAVEASTLERGALQELSKDHRRTRPDRS